MIHTCHWRDLPVDRCDLLCVDAPYSARTHAGHDQAVDPTDTTRHERGRGYAASDRRSIAYPPWSPDDVRAFVAHWHPRTAGWFVTITDHELCLPWCDALAATGRYVFSPMPYVAPGSRVRLAGDGPSSWTCWIVVARPRTPAFARWGTLPGAYVLPSGQGGGMPVVGGKPLWLARALVRDYSRPGDLVCDPCCGAGTTLVATLREGRRAVGGDIDPTHAQMARDWIAEPWSANPAQAARQPSLFGDTP